ncbi:hypothetical protein FRZ67_00975 [Panacibacter ginsenosidivorans]|uniref:Uncharacterized protein n=1 Tax=Panacibacter ginsenosidivorans TaxID=1813871 RepID=A0A5B8V564_9BACT|nr:hypothetical protein [Panacibacter ginsenosidivorans]QEC65943.1 hypothetical protein FRZ67_00975 [Panacibacter ginsenosidivorans]
MKHLLLIFINLFIFISIMHAQDNTVTGVYNLEGVMETASGFKLNADSTFEFYFSYGALDRYGKGKWEIINNKLILNSRPHPGNDFKLLSSAHTNNNFITISIQEKNSMLLSYVYAFAGTLKEGEYPVRADSHGIIKLPASNADTLHLLFEFTPERISSFAVNTKTQNSFSFAFEPWIAEVFFKDFGLTIKEDRLEGKHPLLEKDDCVYTKEQ